MPFFAMHNRSSSGNIENLSPNDWLSPKEKAMKKAVNKKKANEEFRRRQKKIFNNFNKSRGSKHIGNSSNNNKKSGLIQLGGRRGYTIKRGRSGNRRTIRR